MELFNKELSKTDIEKRLCIPTSCLMFLPDFEGAHAVNLLVKDKYYNLWNLSCSIRKEGYKKPVFIGDWLHFVFHNKLRVGDKIIFSLDEDHVTGARYKIEVQRKIILLGKHIWAGM